MKARGGRDFIDATDDTGVDDFPHYRDVVDGGHDQEADMALCDELDVVTNVTVTEGC